MGLIFGRSYFYLGVGGGGLIIGISLRTFWALDFYCISEAHNSFFSSRKGNVLKKNLRHEQFSIIALLLSQISDITALGRVVQSEVKLTQG